MSIDLTETTITDAVQYAFDGCEDPRTRELFVALVRHLHDFAREVALTGEEWFTAIDFLERVGKISSPTRQEYVLLSDILGLSVLVDQINGHHGPCATDSTLLGPFYVEGRPHAENGADISGGVEGMPLFVTSRVVDTEGHPVVGARVDTWHSDGEGFYDVQPATMDAGCYAVHMARTFGGATPEVVSAQAKLRDPQVDRAMTAELRFPGGHTGRVRCSMWSSHLLQFNARVVGDRGELRVLNPISPQIFHRLSVRSTDGKRVERFPRRSSYAFQLDAFAVAVLRDDPVKTNPEDAVENMTVIDAIYRAPGVPLREPS